MSTNRPLYIGTLIATLATITVLIVPAAAMGTALLMGWLFVFSGIIEIVHALGVRRWGGCFLHLIGGIVGALIGLVVVTHPLAGAVGWMLLFASFLTVIVLFRLIAAISLELPHWGGATFDGFVTLGLWVLLWADWPWSGLWFLGLSVGISLVLRGWSYVMFAITIRKLLVDVGVLRQHNRHFEAAGEKRALWQQIFGEQDGAETNSAAGL